MWRILTSSAALVIMTSLATTGVRAQALGPQVVLPDAPSVGPSLDPQVVAPPKKTDLPKPIKAAPPPVVDAGNAAIISNSDVIQIRFMCSERSDWPRFPLCVRLR